MNTSDTTRASNVEIYHSIAFDSLYILTGNDVIIYFRSVANRINALILGHVGGHDFAVKVQSISERFTVLEREIQVLHLLLCDSIDILLLDSENGAQLDQTPSMNYISG